MPKFPVDAPKIKVINALEALGFQLVREGNHISMARKNPDGTRTPLTLANHPRIKGSTLRTICSRLTYHAKNSYGRMKMLDRLP
jgi:predicted RNA binding protein YcfA (HicA-like mRNA interferase family)